MKSLFILQLVCCVITAMLALQLAMASLQVRWKVWRYEISRWILVASMLLSSVHYLLQMIHGLRAQGTDVGAAFNILFYTPVAFAITLSIINIESTGSKVRRYCLRSMMAYILIAIVFVIGMFKSHSLHIGNMLYVMLGLFVASMAYFIFIIRKETKARKQKLMENYGTDLIPYVRYSQASLILLYFAAGFLPVAILFNTLLYIIGPLILLSVIFFVQTFIAMGYYITPKEVIPEDNDAEATDTEAEYTEAEDTKDDKNTLDTNILTANKKTEIELALKKWCEEGFYKDYEVNIYSLATKLGYKKNELTEYFNQS
ncbi:AraC family transcriptional regulator, partial [Prevotellamassilia timonensis]|uniref:AraC family transcriptional regulator n=1 Tax=Prevotellamassilia timonensis TaxID=1852370 RepID=UPI00307BDC60